MRGNYYLNTMFQPTRDNEKSVVGNHSVYKSKIAFNRLEHTGQNGA